MSEKIANREKYHEQIMTRAEAILTGYSRTTLAGATILGVGFSLLTSTDEKFSLFGIILSTEYAPLVLSFVALVVVYHQVRLVKTLDHLFEIPDDKRTLKLLVSSHQAILNPYSQLKEKDDSWVNYMGVALITLCNMIMLFVVEHVAFQNFQGGKVFVTISEIPVYALFLATGILMMVFLARTLKRSIKLITPETSLAKMSVIYFLAPCIYITNKLLFQ